ncbi:MAG: hypothetical protein GXP46_08455 [Deferribacteres bacterium]|nr:hypothetical protein [Deferribacteres bacterium]
MAIEGLNNIYGVPPVGKEQGPGLNQRKKKDRQRKKERKEEDGEARKPGKGRVDIRI